MTNKTEAAMHAYIPTQKMKSKLSARRLLIRLALRRAGSRSAGGYGCLFFRW